MDRRGRRAAGGLRVLRALARCRRRRDRPAADPARHARGPRHGAGAGLVDRTVAFARAAGYRRLVLWTNAPLAAARRIYLERGFRLVDEEPHHSFGVDLVGQNYELAL